MTRRGNYNLDCYCLLIAICLKFAIINRVFFFPVILVQTRTFSFVDLMVSLMHHDAASLDGLIFKSKSPT